MSKYFVGRDDRLCGEVLVDEPANPLGLAIIECALSHPCHEYVVENGVAVHSPPVKTNDEIIAEKKCQRQAIVDAITVTVSTGKVFDGNEDAQSRMGRAIQTAQIANIPSTTWVLANNVPTTVTLAELQEALVLSMQAMGAVWATPYEE